MKASARRERGAAIVEFTIALPLLMVLLLATAELGRMLSHYNTMTKSTRDSARFLAGSSRDTSGVVAISDTVRDQARNLAVTGNINGTGGPLLPGFTISNVTVADAGAGYISVAISYSYVPMLGATLPLFGLGNDISLATPLKSTVVMKALR
jgi:Flp pilus assembly protein TadG